MCVTRPRWVKLCVWVWKVKQNATRMCPVHPKELCKRPAHCWAQHSDITMSAMASLITGASIKIVYSTVCWGANQRKHLCQVLRHWPLWGNPPVTERVPSQGASDAEHVSIWLRHHIVVFGCRLNLTTSCWITSQVMGNLVVLSILLQKY